MYNLMYHTANLYCKTPIQPDTDKHYEQTTSKHIGNNMSSRKLSQGTIESQDRPSPGRHSEALLFRVRGVPVAHLNLEFGHTNKSAVDPSVLALLIQWPLCLQGTRTCVKAVTGVRQ